MRPVPFFNTKNMACTLTGIDGRALPCNKTVGGLKTIYFGAYSESMTAGDGATAPAGSWYQYDLKGASSLETAISGSRENNSVFYTQTINIQLPLLDETTQDEIKILAATKPHIIVEDYNGQQWLAGLEHGCDLTGGSLVTGANLGDFSGFTLTFEALEKNPPAYVQTAVTGAGTQNEPAVTAS